MQVQHLESRARPGTRLLLPSPTPGPLMAGGYGAGDPPDPIPNSEVKTRCADGTAGATRWESTAPPAYLFGNARPDPQRSGRAFVVSAGPAHGPPNGLNAEHVEGK